ncbi:hypothetical protein GCM10022226_61890 [Sphaerisporangium flaviroseum]|uniref:VWA domain-containing protein n=1 Tax=Sphaerisporangium flaviroseum TaxID=509199 RepID=A0ABP7J1E9_9ACTN
MNLSDDPSAQIAPPPRQSRRRWKRAKQSIGDAELASARAHLGARVNAIMEAVTGRPDVLARMVWDQPAGTPPGWFDPDNAEITLNGDLVITDGAEPAQVDPTTRLGRLEQPVLIGVSAHEGGHARSGWDLRELAARSPSPQVRSIAIYLLEPWVEALQLRHRPIDQRWLRTAARHILQFPPASDEMPEVQQRSRALAAALLVLARVDAGVLLPEDTGDIEDVVTDVLGADVLDSLRTLWRQALEAEDGDYDTLVDAAAQITTTMGWDNDPDDVVLPALACHGGGAAAHGSATAADPSGTAPSGQPPSRDPLADAIDNLASSVAEDAVADVQAELQEQRAAAGPDRQVLAERANEAAEQAAATKAAQVFDGGASTRPRGPLRGFRQPTPTERGAANALATHLRHARHRDHRVTTIGSNVPPGRLSMRQVMQGDAQRRLGLAVTAQPFLRRQRARVDEPALIMGFAADVSGSMSATAEALAVAAWVCAQAVRQIDGTAAAIAWGDQITPLMWPGIPPDRVPRLSTNEGTVVLPEAIRALDGALGLSSGGGARLLVIASDGELRDDDAASVAQGLIDRLIRRGCAVLWLCLDGDAQVMRGAVEVDANDPASAANAIGQAAVEALRRAGG